MPSPEALRANEALLEKMLALETTKPWDPRAAVLSGKCPPNPSHHCDPRMNLQLHDMQNYMVPSLHKREFTGRLVLRREHKTQAETEAAELRGTVK